MRFPCFALLLLATPAAAQILDPGTAAQINANQIQQQQTLQQMQVQQNLQNQQNQIQFQLQQQQQQMQERQRSQGQFLPGVHYSEGIGPRRLARVTRGRIVAQHRRAVHRMHRLKRRSLRGR